MEHKLTPVQLEDFQLSTIIFDHDNCDDYVNYKSYVYNKTNNKPVISILESLRKTSSPIFYNSKDSTKYMNEHDKDRCLIHVNINMNLNWMIMIHWKVLAIHI